MTDYYGYEDQQPQQQAEPQQPAGQSQWHGRIARDAQGRRIMWQEAPNGRGGRFVQMGEATATPQTREALQNERGQLAILERVAPLAEEYVRIGNNTPTGGWRQRSFQRESAVDPNDPAVWHGLNFPVQWMDHEERARLERLRGLESEALRANIQPGMAGTANSSFEQETMRGMFPSINILGDANSQRTAALLVRRDLARARINAMEQWLTEHPDLSQFEEAWARQMEPLRQRLEVQSGQQYGTARGARGGVIAGRAGQGQQQPQVGQRRTFQNGAVGEWDGQGWRQVSPPQSR